MRGLRARRLQRQAPGPDRPLQRCGRVGIREEEAVVGDGHLRLPQVQQPRPHLLSVDHAAAAVHGQRVAAQSAVCSWAVEVRWVGMQGGVVCSGNATHGEQRQVS